jgi:hypothetical protein
MKKLYEIYVQLQLLGYFKIASNLMIRQLKASIDAIYGLFWEMIDFKPGFHFFPSPGILAFKHNEYKTV